MQKNRRAQRRMGADCLTIGFAIYHVCEINWFTSYTSQTSYNIYQNVRSYSMINYSGLIQIA